MKVLIADDNVDFCSTISEIVSSFGYETVMFNDPDSAMNYLSENNREIGLALLDIEFGPSEKKTGLDILEHCRKKYPSIPVVMISGKGSIETAVKATKLGAVNFIEKSIVSKKRIKEVLESAVSRLESKGEEKEILHFLQVHGLIGNSRQMIELGDHVIRFGRTDLNILVTGETGTGKKLVAKAIHAVSRRSKNSIVTVDIPNIPKELFQSELFGHIKGAFSGATDTKRGLFHKAHRGTLFLDEIGDMPLDLQSNLLIPIEERQVRKVGSVESEDVDVRIVSATDKNLINEMKDGTFREPLYHRLRECEIYIPPLRERKEDIPLIVDYYLRIHNENFDEQKVFSPSAIEFMSEQIWKGNVRELASLVRVILQTVKNEGIEVSDVHKMLKTSSSSPIVEGKADAYLSADRTLKEDLQQVDKKKIDATLKRCNGNVSKSAAQLGISRETLHNKIRKYDLDVQQYRKNRK
ncbi:MAG: sigma-54 dependent transcriptional regulator [Candidatus Kapaibacterium sp.]